MERKVVGKVTPYEIADLPDRGRSWSRVWSSLAESVHPRSQAHWDALQQEETE